MCNLGGLFGGPSAGEEAAQGTAQNLESTYSADFNQNYKDQSDILHGLNSQLMSTFQAGPNQQGFTGEELAAYKTQAGEGVGQEYAKAQQALGNALAARGGGNEYLPTGGEAQLRATLASSAANQMSAEDLAITRANYAQGRSNWLNALSGLQNNARILDPSKYGELASVENHEVFENARKLNEQRQQKLGNVLGAVTGIATSFLPGGAALNALKGIGGKLFSGSSWSPSSGPVGAAGTGSYFGPGEDDTSGGSEGGPGGFANLLTTAEQGLKPDDPTINAIKQYRQVFD